MKTVVTLLAQDQPVEALDHYLCQRYGADVSTRIFESRSRSRHRYEMVDVDVGGGAVEWALPGTADGRATGVGHHTCAVAPENLFTGITAAGDRDPVRKQVAVVAAGVGLVRDGEGGQAGGRRRGRWDVRDQDPVDRIMPPPAPAGGASKPAATSQPPPWWRAAGYTSAARTATCTQSARRTAEGRLKARRPVTAFRSGPCDQVQSSSV